MKIAVAFTGLLATVVALVVAPVAVAAPDSDDPKVQVREILKDERFHPDSSQPDGGNTPDGPIAGNSPGGNEENSPPPPPPDSNWLDELFAAIPQWLWITLGVVILLIAIFLGVRSARTASIDPEEDDEEPAPRSKGGKLKGPGDFERAAAEAEQAGDFELAVRLYFKAGLLRLIAATAIPDRPGITSGQIAMTINSSDFVSIARAFDEIVYGRRAATANDAKNAKEQWPNVLLQVSGK